MTGTFKPGADLATGSFSWLISDYFVAGELLLVVTGGTALAALVAILFSRTTGAGSRRGLDLSMTGWIVSDVLIVGTQWLQLIYFAVGLAMVVLSVLVGPAQVRATAQRLHLA